MPLESLCRSALLQACLSFGLFLLGQPAFPQSYLDFAHSYAVVIGIHTYNSRQWPDLPYGRADAEAMTKFLSSQGFEVAPLYDSQATRHNILIAVNQFAQRMQPDDRVIFYFSGHGAIEQSSQEALGYIVTYGASGSDDSITSNDIVELSHQMIRARHQLFLFDSCFSGQMITRSGGVNPDRPDYIGELTKRVVREGFAAGGRNQSVLDFGPGGKSVFTSALLKGLTECQADLDKDGFITFAELEAYVTRLASNAFQTPAPGVFPGDEGGQFVFLSPCGRTTPARVAEEPPGIRITRGATDPLVSAKKLLAASRFLEAIPLLREASDAGNTEAKTQLGDLYRMGWGVSRDYQQARSLYEEARAAGSSDASLSLGWLYEQGLDVPQDYARALQLYKDAAAAGNASGSNMVGVMYEDGLGVKASWWEARDRFKKAVAVRADPDFILNLGVTYEDEKDYKKAMEWYQKAAVAGNAGAMLRIGYLYYTGYGKAWGNPKYDVARDWFEKSASAGDPYAMRMLGDMYFDGDGGEQDYTLARSWYEKAAAGGVTAAMISLGDMYRDGKGVHSDPQQALQWYQRAAAIKDKNTNEAIKRINKL